MEEDKSSRQSDKSTDEQLWAVYVQGPEDLVAMTSKSAAEKYANELNTLHEAQALGQKGALPSIHAVVTPSPWLALEHWRHCAEIQEQWIDELETRLQVQTQNPTPIAYLVPDEERMAKAWHGPGYVAGLSAVPRQVRDYTITLLNSLPARASAGNTKSYHRPEPGSECLSRAVRRAITDLSLKGYGGAIPRPPGQAKDSSPLYADPREVIQLLRQWGAVKGGQVKPQELIDDEMCNKDYHAAQMGGALNSSSPADIWRAAYASALNRILA